MLNPHSCPACECELSREPAVEGLCPGCLTDLALGSIPQPALCANMVEDTELPLASDDACSPGFDAFRYRIHSLLGRGGIGEVWRAIDVKLCVEVALKTLKPHLLEDGKAMRILRDEVRMAREVISPNVCRVFDLIELDGQEVLSMEYIDGVTLLEVLKEKAPLSLAEAAPIAVQLLAGLEAIHAAGLAHRDVKPENLMITPSGRAVLMDLGAASSFAERTPRIVSGTPGYMAPEQARGGPPSSRSDVFSAGIVLAEMIAPGGASCLAARQAVWSALHRNPPQVAPSPWAQVIRRAVARDPARRFPTATAMADALRECAS